MDSFRSSVSTILLYDIQNGINKTVDFFLFACLLAIVLFAWFGADQSKQSV